MPRFELKQSTRHITSHAGLFLIGQCLAAAGFHLIDSLFPVAKGQIRTSDIIKSYIGLLALGKSDINSDRAKGERRSFSKKRCRLKKSRRAPGCVSGWSNWRWTCARKRTRSVCIC